MANRRCGIYQLRHQSGAFYIGSSVNLPRRKREHWRAIRDGRGPCKKLLAFARARAAGPDDFAFDVVLYCDAGHRKFYEDRFIAAHHRTDLSLNAMQSGNVHDEPTRARIAERLRGRKTGPMSAERKAHLSRVGKGRKMSPEHYAAVCVANRTPEHRQRSREARLGPLNHLFGKSPSAETRAKMSASNRGYQSPETRAKIAAAKRGVARPDLIHGPDGRFLGAS